MQAMIQAKAHWRGVGQGLTTYQPLEVAPVPAPAKTSTISINQMSAYNQIGDVLEVGSLYIAGE